MKLSIRVARPEDGAAVARIYEPYVLKTPISFEETPPAAEEMSDRIRQTLPRFPYLIAEADGEVAGYACAGAHASRASYRWGADVAIYLAQSHHRRGIGAHLYGQLLPLLIKQRFVKAYAGVTLPNAASVGLHESLGFKLVGIYRNVGYKMGAWRDVGWWDRNLVESIPNRPDEPIPFNSLPEFKEISLEIR
jgi:phosphinothricin acetyltransferase